MKQFLLIAAVASVLLYRTLCAGFDMAQEASKESVKFQEQQVNEVTQ